MKQYQNYIGIGLLILLCLAFSASITHGEEDPDLLARQAREMRLKARAEHCKRIGTKVAECYAGDMATCDKLQDSIAWFTGEYGETPELACSTIPDPLEFGGAQE